jgi:hypothetical protein
MAGYKSPQSLEGNIVIDNKEIYHGDLNLDAVAVVLEKVKADVPVSLSFSPGNLPGTINALVPFLNVKLATSAMQADDLRLSVRLREKVSLDLTFANKNAAYLAVYRANMARCVPGLSWQAKSESPSDSLSEIKRHSSLRIAEGFLFGSWNPNPFPMSNDTREGKLAFLKTMEKACKWLASYSVK